MNLENVVFHKLDIANLEYVTKFVEWLKQTYGGLDTLVYWFSYRSLFIIYFWGVHRVKTWLAIWNHRSTIFVLPCVVCELTKSLKMTIARLIMLEWAHCAIRMTRLWNACWTSITLEQWVWRIIFFHCWKDLLQAHVLSTSVPQEASWRYEHTRFLRRPSVPLLIMSTTKQLCPETKVHSQTPQRKKRVCTKYAFWAKTSPLTYRNY